MLSRLRYQFVAPLAAGLLTWFITGLVLAELSAIASGTLVALGLAIVLGVRAERRLETVEHELFAAAEREAFVLYPPNERDQISRVAFLIDRYIDIEERQQQVERLEIQRQVQLLDRMSDGVMRVNGQGTVLYSNLAAGVLLGGRNPTEGSFILATRDHELNDHLLRCLETGEEFQYTLDLTAEARVINAVLVRLSAEPPEALVVLRDVTELSRLQTLRRDFVANVSHELRTPLTTIKILTETLMDMHAAADAELQFLTKIDHEIDAITELVNDLLDLARLESPAHQLKLRRAKIVRMLAEVQDRMGPIAERQGVELVIDDRTDGARFVADDRRLRYALLNLVHNAIQATPSGGQVTLTVRDDNDRYAFEVADTGVGIAPNDLERIWERFFKVDRSRTKPGSGLGLAIVKHAVLAHGGTVDATSEPGEGSTFTITIPKGLQINKKRRQALSAARIEAALQDSSTDRPALPDEADDLEETETERVVSTTADSLSGS